MGKKNKNNANKQQNQASPVGGVNIKNVPGKNKNKQNSSEVIKVDKTPNTTNESLNIESEVSLVVKDAKSNTPTVVKKSIDVEPTSVDDKIKASNEEVPFKVQHNKKHQERHNKGYNKNCDGNQPGYKTRQFTSRNGPHYKGDVQTNKPPFNKSKHEVTKNIDESWDQMDDFGEFDNLSLKTKEDETRSQPTSKFCHLNPEAKAWPDSPGKDESDPLYDNDVKEYKKDRDYGNNSQKNKSYNNSGNDRPSKSGYKKNDSSGQTKGRPAWLDDLHKNNENNQKIDDGVDKFERAYNKVLRDLKDYKYTKIVEQQADLFAMGKEYSLAHCVAEDMGMGSGIAVQFRRDFKRVDELLNQRARQGDMAILEDNGRYIYYLVTKRESSGKPTYDSFFLSLTKWRDHVQQHRVKKLAIPRIGCGLDRLEWDKVKYMMEYLFEGVDTEIVVCNFQQAEETGPSRITNCKVVHEKYPLSQIERDTIILYWASEDGHVTDVIEDLDKKFNILRDYKTAKRTLGEVVLHDKSKQNYLIYGCVIRKRHKDLLDFVALQNCVRAVQKRNRKDQYEYVGVQAVKDTDFLLNKKIINILRNSFTKLNVYVCWPGDLENDMP